MDMTPDTRLNRRDAAAALTAAGFRTTPATLATYEARRIGPAFVKISNRAIYQWNDLLAWAQGRIIPSKSHA